MSLSADSICEICGSWGVSGELSDPVCVNLSSLWVTGCGGCVTCSLLWTGAVEYFAAHKWPGFADGTLWVKTKGLRGWFAVEFSSHKDMKAAPVDGKPRQTFVLEYTHSVDDGKSPSEQGQGVKGTYQRSRVLWYGICCIHG